MTHLDFDDADQPTVTTKRDMWVPYLPPRFLKHAMEGKSKRHQRTALKSAGSSSDSKKKESQSLTKAVPVPAAKSAEKRKREPEVAAATPARTTKKKKRETQPVTDKAKEKESEEDRLMDIAVDARLELKQTSSATSNDTKKRSRSSAKPIASAPEKKKNEEKKKKKKEQEASKPVPTRQKPAPKQKAKGTKKKTAAAPAAETTAPASNSKAEEAETAVTMSTVEEDAKASLEEFDMSSPITFKSLLWFGREYIDDTYDATDKSRDELIQEVDYPFMITTDSGEVKRAERLEDLREEHIRPFSLICVHHLHKFLLDLQQQERSKVQSEYDKTICHFKTARAKLSDDLIKSDKRRIEQEEKAEQLSKDLKNAQANCAKLQERLARRDAKLSTVTKMLEDVQRNLDKSIAAADASAAAAAVKQGTQDSNKKLSTLFGKRSNGAAPKPRKNITDLF
jgi:hypothetical protein